MSPAIKINLVSHQEFDQSPLGKLLRWSLTYGRYIIICTEVVVLLAFIYRFSLDRKITDLGEEVTQKSAIVEANQAFEDQFRNLQTRTQKIGELFTNQDLLIKILHHLETITPSGITFTAFSYSGMSISINATTNTNSDLALFLNNLKNSNLLTQINLTNLNKKSSGAGVTTFKIDAKVKK